MNPDQVQQFAVFDFRARVEVADFANRGEHALHARDFAQNDVREALAFVDTLDFEQDVGGGPDRRERVFEFVGNVARKTLDRLNVVFEPPAQAFEGAREVADFVSPIGGREASTQAPTPAPYS